MRFDQTRQSMFEKQRARICLPSSILINLVGLSEQGLTFLAQVNYS
jgi:hypothetical protein